MKRDEIKAMRQRLGLTQQQMSQRLGVTMMTVSRWERGQAVPSPLALQRLKEMAEGARP